MLAVMGQQGWDLPRALVPPLCALGVRVPTSAPCMLVQTYAHAYGRCACAHICSVHARANPCTSLWALCVCCVLLHVYSAGHGVLGAVHVLRVAQV